MGLSSKLRDWNTYGFDAGEFSSWLGTTSLYRKENTPNWSTALGTALQVVPANKAISAVDTTRGHATITNITVNNFGDCSDFDMTIQVRTDNYNAINKFVDLVNKTIDFEKENTIMPTKPINKDISNKTATEKTLAKKSFTVPAIKHVTYNKKKGKECVVVIFEDGTSVVQKMFPGDQFDLSIGVALAIASKMFGSKTQFHKVIEAKDSIAKKERKAAKKAAKKE